MPPMWGQMGVSRTVWEEWAVLVDLDAAEDAAVQGLGGLCPIETLRPDYTPCWLV